MELSELMRKKPKETPAFICADCGTMYGRRDIGVATWHIGYCDICGDYCPVTEPRDFGGLLPGWKLDMEEV